MRCVFSLVFLVSCIIGLSTRSGGRFSTDRVKVDIHMEAMCPACKQYFTTEVANAVKELGDHFDLKIFPYGNAEQTQNGSQWQFECQHGPDECHGNLIEACAMDQHKQTKEWFPFLQCMEESDGLPASVAQDCAKKSFPDSPTAYTSISSCASGTQGQKLMHQIALKTEGLNPPHQWTPWVVLNDKSLTETEYGSTLVQLICDNIKGSKPAECAPKAAEMKQDQTGNKKKVLFQKRAVCYRNSKTKRSSANMLVNNKKGSKQYLAFSKY